MRCHRSSGASTTARVASTTRPITTTLSSVPSPGRSRIGIQSSSTTAPMRMVTFPIAMPVRSDTPWWRTSQGASPRSARTISAMPIPKSTRPPSSRGTRRRSSSAGGNGSIPARYGAGMLVPSAFRLRSRTRITWAAIGESSSPPALVRTSTPWVAPLVSVKSSVALEVTQHAVAPAGDEGLGDRLLGAVDVEPHVDRALEGVGLARQGLRGGDGVAGGGRSRAGSSRSWRRSRTRCRPRAGAPARRWGHPGRTDGPPPRRSGCRPARSR